MVLMFSSSPCKRSSRREPQGQAVKRGGVELGSASTAARLGRRPPGCPARAFEHACLAATTSKQKAMASGIDARQFADLKRDAAHASPFGRVATMATILRVIAEFVHVGASQQIRGSCSPTSMSTMRRPPKSVRMVDAARVRRRRRCRSRAAPRAQRMRPHRGERGFGLLGRHEGDDLAFVGEVERIEPEDLADAPHLLAGSAVARLVDLDADLPRPRRSRSAPWRVRRGSASRKAARVAAPPRAAPRSARAARAQSLSIGVSSAMSPRAARIAAP